MYYNDIICTYIIDFPQYQSSRSVVGLYLRSSPAAVGYKSGILPVNHEVNPYSLIKICLLLFYNMLAYKHNDLSKHYRRLIIMFVYRRLLTACLYMAKQLCYSKLCSKKQRNLFVQDYNHTYIAVHFIMKHTLIISRMQDSFV